MYPRAQEVQVSKSIEYGYSDRSPLLHKLMEELRHDENKIDVDMGNKILFLHSLAIRKNVITKQKIILIWRSRCSKMII